MVEDQRVEHQTDGSLDGVLEADEAEVDVATARGGEHLGERAERLEVGVLQVALRQQRLLAEGARRAEKGDPRHERAGY